MRYIVRRQTSASAESALPSEETDITSKEPADHERPDQPQASGIEARLSSAILAPNLRPWALSLLGHED